MCPDPNKSGASGDETNDDLIRPDESSDGQGSSGKDSDKGSRLPDGTNDPNPTHREIDATIVHKSSTPDLTDPQAADLERSHSDQTNLTKITSEVSSFGNPHVDKTEREQKTAANYEATLGSRPGFEVDDEDDLHLGKTRATVDLPTHIGRYEIKRLLGEGTFGKVYEARDPQLDRIVAVKVAKAISGRTQIRRFLREARAAAQLRHPNIIPVYEYGQVEGENIIVYQYVAGETLKGYLKRTRIPPLDDTIRIVREIAEGLNYAHEQGIIHRDMKPENVLIDGYGRPHIADFGCARSIDDNTNLTINGSILGTPMYMSPEQASGKANVADSRTDIWSLGVILYEMVSGKRPFQGQLSDLLFWICNKDPSPLRKVQSDAPADIETICGKCLARELEGRFETAKILSDELGRFQRGEPIKSRRIGTFKRTWMWAKRNRAVASLLAVVAVTLLVGSIVSSIFAIQAHREKRNRAFAQLNALTSSEASALPGIFEALMPYRATILPQLKERLANSDKSTDERHRLHMAIIELEEDPEVRIKLADEMVEDLLTADPGDFFVCRECLKFRKNELSQVLWDAASDLSPESSGGKRFRAAAALALYDSDSPNWESIAPDVAGYLTSISEIEMSHWLPSIVPIRSQLKRTLVNSYLDRRDQLDPTPRRAAAILSRLFTDDVQFLVSLVPDATATQIPYLAGAFEINRSDAIKQLQSELDSKDSADQSIARNAIEQANLVTTLIQLSDDRQFSRFAGGSDMSLATELVEQLGPASTSFETVGKKIRQWNSIEADVVSGILLSLGQFKQNQILASQKSNLLPTLVAIFNEHPDSRVHSCSRWLLEQWGFHEDVKSNENRLRRAEPDPRMNWHVDPIGNTFAIFGPVESTPIGMNDQVRKRWSEPSRVASSGFDASKKLGEPGHLKSIPRRFGICIHEVSVGQYESYQREIIAGYQKRIANLDVEITALEQEIAADNKDSSTDESNEDKEEAENKDGESTDDKLARLNSLKTSSKRLSFRLKERQRKFKRRAELDKQLPVGDVDFFAALGYCRWISEKLNTDCGLPAIDQLQDFYDRQTDFVINQDHLDKIGYRLPTAAEWEYACRGGTDTLFPFGQTPRSAGKYAWYASNSDVKLQPIGQLKPGNSGLFDVLGNVSEWCLDWYREELPKSESGKTRDLYVDFGPDFNEKYQSPDREYRGGSFENQVFDLRSSARFHTRPIQGFARLGFRLARTYESSTNN